ncbi:SEC-C metal-binding domain-containing protein [Clostridium estertheticum]
MCPCSSGKLYKDCCKVKKPKQFHTQGEALNFMGKMMKKK